MILEMKVPSPGESITEVEIAQWLVEDGDYVEKDQAIAEVDSDKATSNCLLKSVEPSASRQRKGCCCSRTSGLPYRYRRPSRKDRPPVKQPLPSRYSCCCSRCFGSYANQLYNRTASPAAKKIIAEKGLEASQIQGSGRDGRITKADAMVAKAAMGSVSNLGKRGEERKDVYAPA